MNLGQNTIGTMLQGASQAAVMLWAKPASFTATAGTNQAFASQMGGNATALAFGFYDSASTSNKMRIAARSQASDGGQTALSTTVLSTGTLYHLGARIDYGGSKIYVYVNGVLETTQTVTFGSATYAHTNVTGAYEDMLGAFGAPFSVPASTTQQFDGELSELVLWKFAGGDVAMADADFAFVAAGGHPRRVAKGTMIYYQRILGTASPEVPDVGSGNGTITGSLPQATHPTVYGGPSVFNRRLRAA